MTDPIQTGDHPGSRVPGSPAPSSPPLAQSEPPLPAVEPVEPRRVRAGRRRSPGDGAASGTQPGRPSRRPLGDRPRRRGPRDRRDRRDRRPRQRPPDAVDRRRLHAGGHGPVHGIPARPAGRPARRRWRRSCPPFPGFDDQAPIDTKLDEMFDRILAAATRERADLHGRHRPVVRRHRRHGQRCAQIRRMPAVGMRVFGASDAVVVLTVKDRDWPPPGSKAPATPR